MKYEVEVTQVGETVKDLLEASQDLIIFDTCPMEALAEVSIMHTHCELGDIKVGDTVTFGEKKYTITAIGGEAIHTLSTLGHCTFKFNGHDTTELPGQIELKGDGLPDLKVGDKIRIE